jgi:hypothetical protein
MRVHGNVQHYQKRVDGNELFKNVRLQSWFQDGKQRYWIVDESEKGVDRVEDDEVTMDKGRASRSCSSGVVSIEDQGMLNGFGHSANDDYKDSSVDTGGDNDEDMRSESRTIVVDDDSDADYEGSSWVTDDDDEEDEGTSVIEVDDEDDNGRFADGEDEAIPSQPIKSRVSNSGRKRKARRQTTIDSDDGTYQDSDTEIEERIIKRHKAMPKFDDGIMIGSSQGDDDQSVGQDDQRSNNCNKITDDSNDSDACLVVIWRKRRAAARAYERKMQRGIVCRVGHDDTAGKSIASSSPVINIPAKRQRTIPMFFDSGVMMGSSQNSSVRSTIHDDGPIPPSSPPIYNRVDDKIAIPGQVSTVPIVIQDDSSDEEQSTSFEDTIEYRHQSGVTIRSKLDELRDRLEEWCRMCPVCYLGGSSRFRTHDISSCWRERTSEIIDKVVGLQLHIMRWGGFRGRDSCSSCGVPRTLCQQWQVKSGVVVEEQQCQYKLAAAFMTMIVDGSMEGKAVTGCWMDRDGVNRTKEAEVWEWYGQETWWNDIGMEVTQMVRVFNMLVNKNMWRGSHRPARIYGFV